MKTRDTIMAVALSNLYTEQSKMQGKVLKEITYKGLKKELEAYRYKKRVRRDKVCTSNLYIRSINL